MKTEDTYYNKFIKKGYKSPGGGYSSKQEEQENIYYENPCKICCGIKTDKENVFLCPKEIQNQSEQEKRQKIFLSEPNFGANIISNGYMVIYCPTYKSYQYINIFEPVKGSKYINYINKNNRLIRIWKQEHIIMREKLFEFIKNKTI